MKIGRMFHGFAVVDWFYENVNFLEVFLCSDKTSNIESVKQFAQICGK